MKTSFFKCGLLLMGIALFTTGLLHAQDPKQVRKEQIQGSYMLAFGRAPSDAEISYWQGRIDAKNSTDFVKFHKSYIQQDAGTRRAVIIKAYNDAMGRNPSASEIDYWAKYNQSYVELMSAHVTWLRGNPAEYEKVIKNSYQFVLGRQPSTPELAYWKGQGVLSYLMLVGCHQDWVRRSGAATPKTSGPLTISSNSSSVVQVPLSVTATADLKNALVALGAGVIAAGGGNVIAAGGGNVIAAGGGNVIAAGGGN